MKKKPRNKITHRQKKALENIAEGKTYRQAILEAGYSESVANQGRDGIFRAENIRQLDNAGEVSEIIARFKRIAKTCEDKRDYVNSIRANECLARINAMFTDKQQITAEITQHPDFIKEIDTLFLTSKSERIKS